MFVKKTITGILLGGLFFTPAMAAPAKVTAPIQTTRPIYSWHTESENNKTTGKFDNCLVKNMYDNGTLVILAENNHGEKRLALNFPQNKMSEGQRFDLALQVDRRDVFPVEAIAISPQTLGISIPDALPDQMRKGQLLHMRGPNDEVVFALDGINGAVMSLHDCIIAQKNGTGASTAVASNETPEMAPPAPVKQQPVEEKPQPKPEPKLEPKKAEIIPPEPKVEPAPVIAEAKTIVPVQTKALSNPIPDKILPPASIAPVATAPAPATTNPITKLANKIEALQDNKIIETATDPEFSQPWKNVFAGTNYSPDRLIPMKNKKADQPLDYIWKNNNVFIGVKGKTIQPNDELNKMSVDYLKMLKTRCAGNFVAQSVPSQLAAKANTTWQVAEAACSNSSNGDSIAAMIFAFTPQGGQIYFFESKAAQGSDAIKARDTILKKIVQ